MAQITVIIPVYKVEKYINKCVDSVLDQSFRDFDLILVDDGSPDACPQICDDYAAQDDRITVIHKVNGGLSDARNAGIDWAMEHSDSEWLAFVDSDDYLHPDYLMTLYQTMQKEGADLVICDFVHVNDGEEIIENKHDFFDLSSEDKRTIFECMQSNWRVVPAWNKLYCKSIFCDYRFAFGKIHEDEFAIHHVLWNCNKAAFIPDGLYFYRIRDNSIMKTETPKSRLDALEALVERYEFCMAHGLMDANMIPTDYIHTYSSLKKALPYEEKKRYNNLMRRFSELYFSEPANRNPKRWAAFRLSGFYHRMAKVYNMIGRKAGREEA